MKRILIFLFIISLKILPQVNRTDTLNAFVPTDTSFVNITNADSLKKKSFDVDDIIYSSAYDSIRFDLINKKMFIYGIGELKYKKTSLTGGKININFETTQLEAEGILNSADSIKEKYSQTPVLQEAGDTYEGTKLKYNFRTKKGFISAAKNVKDDTKYEGSAVKKVDENTYFVKDGLYTTCKEDTPHTYFTASEMKVIQKDKIIAKWIFMYIGGVPLPIPIPFAVFPNQKGRRSGIISPSYGTTANRGQYFRNFGYFFAISDYMDLALTADYYTRGGYGLRSRYRYANRYNYSGNLNVGYSKILIGEDTDPDKQRTTDWNLSLNHNQTFTPTLNLSANLSFQSRTFLQNNTTSWNDFLTQDITSNATLSKRWEESGNSLTLNYSRTQSLKTGDIREILPSVTFNKALTYPFKRKGSSSRDQAWYEYIGYNYSGQFRNNRNKIGGDLQIRGGIQHNIALNASPKIGYFNLSPRFNYVEKWYNKKTKRVYESTSDVTDINNFRGEYLNIINSSNEKLIESDVNELNMIRTFNFGLSTSTKFYGTAQPKLFGIDAFRHTVTPTISYNYNPDFSDEKWGYYEETKRIDGTLERYDPFAKEVFSGVSRGESQSINLSIGNIFEIKTSKDPTDTTSKSEKITLLNLDFSTGYNFAADSLNLSDLRINYRTQIGSLLNFSGSSSFTFYDYLNDKKINTYLASSGKGLFRMTNLNLNISTSISGDKLKGESRTGKKDEPPEDFQNSNKKDYVRLYDEEENDFSIPWNLSLNYNFNLNKTDPTKSIINSNLGVNLGFNLAKNWKFGVRGNYDFQHDEISAPQITVYRDLECWEMNFSWNPLGTYTGFRFEIRMKAPDLRDIKVTRTRGIYTGR